MDGLAPAAEEAGATDDRRGHRQQHVAVGGLDDVGGQRDLPRGEQHAGDPGGQAGEDEAPGSDLGQADPGSPRRLGVAADGVHVAAEAGPLQQDRRGGEHDKDDRNDIGNPLDRPEVGSVDVADGDERDSRRRDEDDLQRGEAARRSLQAGAALAGVLQPEPRGGASDQHGQQDPADHRVEPPIEDVVEDDFVGEPGVADADERPAEDDDPHPLQDQQPAERDDERRHPQPGHERSLDGANRSAGEQRHDDRRPPRKIRAARLHKLGHHDAAKPHDQADREVDLAEEQGEDLSHRQHHVHGALLEEVDQVLRRQELSVRDLEADGDHHDGQDHGQDTAVATADPEPRGPEVLAERLGEEPSWEVSRGDLGVEGKVGHPGARRPGRGLAGVRGHGDFPIACLRRVVRHGSRSLSRAVTARQPALR